MAKQPVSSKVVTKKHLDRSHREQKQTRIILIVSGIVLAIILGLLAYALIDNYLVKPNKIVTNVDGTPIKVGEFQKQVKYSRLNALNTAYTYYQYSQMFGEYGGDYLTAAQNIVAELFEPTTFAEGVLDTMIDDVLIAKEAQRLGVEVSDEEIEEALQEAFEYFPNGTKTPTITATVANTPTISGTQLAILKYTDTPEPTATSTSTPEGWEPTYTRTLPSILTPTEEQAATEQVTATEPVSTATTAPTATVTPTPTPYTTQGFARAVKDYLNNIDPVNLSREELRDVFRKQLLRDKLRDALTTDLEPVEEQVWARHILVDTEEKALELREKLINGENWTVLVDLENAQFPDSTISEDLGWFGKGQMEEPFETAAFALSEIGEISQPVQTSFGWHVIQLIGKGPVDLSAGEFASYKDQVFQNKLAELRESKSEQIVRMDGWEEFVPDVPSVPSTFLSELYSAGL